MEVEINDLEQILRNYYQSDEDIRVLLAKFTKKIEEKRAEKFIPDPKDHIGHADKKVHHRA